MTNRDLSTSGELRDLRRQRDWIGEPLAPRDEATQVWGRAEECVRETEVMKAFPRSCLGAMEMNYPCSVGHASTQQIVVELRPPNAAMDVNRIEVRPIYLEVSHCEVPAEGT